MGLPDTGKQATPINILFSSIYLKYTCLARSATTSFAVTSLILGKLKIPSIWMNRRCTKPLARCIREISCLIRFGLACWYILDPVDTSSEIRIQNKHGISIRKQWKLAKFFAVIYGIKSHDQNGFNPRYLASVLLDCILSNVLQSHLWWPWLQTCIDDFLDYVKAIQTEFSSAGRTLPEFTAQTFLERLVQARRNLSIGDLHESLDEIHKRVKPLHWESEDDLKDLELEVSRIVANVIGLAIVTSVNFPMGMSQTCITRRF